MKGRGIIAAGHPQTAEAGRLILQAGGNAFDAAIAAMLAAFFAEPLLAAPAGGGFLISGTGSQQRIFDFFCQTPGNRQSQSDLFPIEGNFGATRQQFHIGVGAIATPGIVAGIHTIHRSLCSLPLTELVQPAIDLANRGVSVNHFQGYIGEILHPIVSATDLSTSLYCDAAGAPLKVGTVFRNDQLRDFLEHLAREPEDWFYQGEPAQSLVRLCSTAGGHLTAADLTNYQVAVRQPLTRTVVGHQLSTNPVPSCGGALIAFALAVLEQCLPQNSAVGSADHATALAVAMEAMNQSRVASTINLHPTPEVSNRLLDEHLRAQVLAARRQYKAVRGTTHISVADQNGHLAGLTVTNGEGCGHILEGTGIMLNNMLGEEDVNPCGFDQWPLNKRISSMMAPTLLTHPDGLGLALGSGGSNRIRTAITQVIANMLMLNCELEEAVRAPRMHLEDELLSLEPGWSAAAVKPLESRFAQLHHWDRQNLFFGGVHAAGFNASGRWVGCGDPRRGGACLTA